MCSGRIYCGFMSGVRMEASWRKRSGTRARSWLGSVISSDNRGEQEAHARDGLRALAYSEPHPRAPRTPCLDLALPPLRALQRSRQEALGGKRSWGLSWGQLGRQEEEKARSLRPEMEERAAECLALVSPGMESGDSQAQECQEATPAQPGAHFTSQASDAFPWSTARGEFLLLCPQQILSCAGPPSWR